MSGCLGQKAYKLRYREGFEWLLPVDDRDFEQLRFDGRPRAASWTPVKMKRLIVSEQGRPLKPGDFFACSGGDMLVFSNRAKEILGADLARYGEVLPLSCAGGHFWTLNVTSFLDALDESASQVVRASDTGGILMIRLHVLKAAAVVGADLFKLPQTPRGLIYATDSFGEKLKRHNLSGLELVQVWAPNR